MMIPGAWEPRRRFGALVDAVEIGEPPVSAPAQPAASRGGNGSGPETPRPELPAWLKVSIFAATLLSAMWLAMAAF